MTLSWLDYRNVTVYLVSLGHINLEFVCICQLKLIYYDTMLAKLQKCNGLFGLIKS